MTTALEPYTILWTTVSQFYDKFSSWMNGPFIRLNPEEVESDTNDAFRRLYKLTKLFSGQSGQEARPAPLAIAEEGKGKVAMFQVNRQRVTLALKRKLKSILKCHLPSLPHRSTSHSSLLSVTLAFGKGTGSRWLRWLGLRSNVTKLPASRGCWTTTSLHKCRRCG